MTDVFTVIFDKWESFNLRMVCMLLRVKLLFEFLKKREPVKFINLCEVKGLWKVTRAVKWARTFSGGYVRSRPSNSLIWFERAAKGTEEVGCGNWSWLCGNIGGTEVACGFEREVVGKLGLWGGWEKAEWAWLDKECVDVGMEFEVGFEDNKNDMDLMI